MKIFILIIMLLGIVAGVYLSQHRQNIQSKAAYTSPDFAKNNLLNNASVPVDRFGNRIVFQNPHYYVEYQPPFDLFMLVVHDNPIEQVREEAEKDLLSKAGNNLDSLCRLKFNIVAEKEVTDDGYVASDDTLGICKELQTQLGNRLSDNFTPSLGNVIRSVASAITHGGSKPFLSDKPIIASENLPGAVYITLCRNDSTDTEGVWQINQNPQAADFLYNQEVGRCSWPVPNYLVFTQDVPTGAYLSLCTVEGGSEASSESVWQVNSSGRVADFLYTQDGCSQVPPLPKPQPEPETRSRLFFFPVSGQKCSIVNEGYCSVEFLTPYFASNAQKASIVCYGESGGNVFAVNANCKTNDYSVGLFQINLVGSCRGAYGAGSWGSQSCDNLLSIEKRNSCEQQWRNNLEENIQKAVAMSGGGTNWSAWGVAKACGIR